MRNLSLTMRRALTGQEAGEVAVVLLTISHPILIQPIRLSSDPTQRIQNTPLNYGTVSRGQYYTFFPFSISLPDDVSERAPGCQIQIENVSRNIIELIRSVSTKATVTIELVLASSPSNIEVSYPTFNLNTVSYNADTITLELEMDSLVTEPFPAHKFTPNTFPSLF